MQILRILLLLVAITATALAQQKPLPSVAYHLSITDQRTESFQIEAVLRNITSDTLIFNFPIWAPGAYDLVYFGRFVDQMKATTAEGKALKVMKIDSNGFAIVGVRPGTKLSYRVHDIETLPNSLWFCLSDIEPDMAYAVGSALFGYPAGYKEIPYSLTCTLPKGWDLAIPLEAAPGGKGEYIARDYDELVDAPIQAGRLQRLGFMEGGKPHYISVWSPRPLSGAVSEELVESTRKIVATVSGFFGEMPYKSYLFQIFLVDPKPGELVFGALEHANSSSYRWPYRGGRPGGGFEPIVAHEYWHLWSPKRFHVKELGPFDYQRPARTSSLWFAEGLTEYYANLLLMRNGMLSSDAIFEEFSRGVRAMKGQAQQMSLAEISMQIPELDIYRAMSLYRKGPVVGLLLDVAIRSQTGNTRSLDDAMRAINDEYGKTGRSFTDDELIPIIERATGTSLQEFNRRYIVGREPLPFEEYLPAMGLRFSDSSESRSSFGGEFEKADTSGWRVTSVTPHGTLDSLGIRAGDLVTGIKIGEEALATGMLDVSNAALLAQLRPGSTLTTMVDGKARRIRLAGSMEITWLHDGSSRTSPLRFARSQGPRKRLVDDPDATPTAVAIRRAVVGR
jgi:predicted metalloprotease with PDZ domain